MFFGLLYPLFLKATISIFNIIFILIRILVTYAGYVGLLTGLRPGAFSITINQRNEGNRFLNFLEALFIPGTRVLPFLIRDTLQDQSNFSAATQVLSTTSLAAPCYITVAGVQLWEGMVCFVFFSARSHQFIGHHP